MSHVHKVYKCADFKITVEELPARKRVGLTRFITTFWNTETCLEVDRDVYEFETFGGAMECAFDLSVEMQPDRDNR